LIGATLVACNTPPPPAVDGGPGDTGAPTLDGGHDAGASGVCDTPMAVTLATGMQSVMGDTTGHTTGLVTLGANCGGQTAGAQMAEQVIALTLPGASTDTVAVSFTFLNAGTNMMFDTTTELRTSCTDSTGSTCFDDSNVARDFRSDGVFTAPGGSTRFLIVTGYRMPGMGYTNVGPWKADFTTYVNPQPPVLATATASLRDGDLLTIHATGMDPQSAADGIVVTYLDTTGAPIGLDLDNMPTTPAQTDLGPYNFLPSVRGMMNFDGGTRITGWGVFANLATAPQLRVSVRDAANLMSNELTIPLVHSTTVHVGDACDTDTHLCAGGVDCTGTPTVCTVPAAVATECAAAMTLTVPTPTTATTSMSTTLTFTTGMGLLEGSCMGQGGMGDERIVSVTVPAGNFDLIAETPDMAEMGLDSVIYDRTVCGDPSSETQCNDDRSTMPHSLSSLITVQNAAPGTHFIVVDPFMTLTATDPMSTMLTVSLRPVLATGTACDPNQVMNRCMGARCPMTGTAVCP